VRRPVAGATQSLGAWRPWRPLPSEPPRLLRVVEAAGLLAISRRHLTTLIALGDVNVVRPGRCVRAPRAEVDRLCAGTVGR
jgi:excisionase family DNA binding protein